MFARLPDVGAARRSPITIDGVPFVARAGDTVAAALLAVGPPCVPHDAGHRRAARAVLHDGRVLRLPRRRSTGVRTSRRAVVAPACACETGMASVRTQRGTRMTTLDVAIVGAGPAGLAAATLCAERGLSTCALRRAARRPAARSIAASRRAPRRARRTARRRLLARRGAGARRSSARARATCRGRRCGRSSARDDGTFALAVSVGTAGCAAGTRPSRRAR